MACECTKCPLCEGTGSIWYDIGGKYVGQHHIDDTDSLEPCEECGGSGITEVCGECMDAGDEE